MSVIQIIGWSGESGYNITQGLATETGIIRTMGGDVSIYNRWRERYQRCGSIAS